MKVLGLIVSAVILIGSVVHPGETYNPGTLCLYQSQTFYERFGLEFAYRIINKKTAARVILVHNVSSMWVDESIVHHNNDVFMLILGRTSKMFELWEELNKKHPVTGFEFVGAQVDNGYEPFLNWATRYVPSYDVANETTLPPFMLLEDESIEADFADRFLEAKYPNSTFNDSRSSMDSVRESDLTLSRATRRYRSDRKFERGKRITMAVKDLAENEDEGGEQDEEDAAVREKEDLDRGVIEQDVDNEQKEQDAADLEKEQGRLYRVKKPLRAAGYKLRAYTRRSKNRVLYARMGRGIDYFRNPYRIETIKWPSAGARSRSPKRVKSQNRIRNQYQPINRYQPMNQAQLARINEIIYGTPQAKVAPSHTSTVKLLIAEESKTTKVKATRRTKSASAKAKRVRPKRVLKSVVRSAIRAVAQPVVKVVAESALKAAAKSPAKTAVKSAAKSAPKSVKSVAKSAGRSVAKSAVKSVAKSAVKSVAKSAVKSVAKSVVKTGVKSAAKKAGKSAAKSVAKASIKPRANRGRKKSTSTLIDYITYMEPGPFMPYRNTKPEERRRQVAG